MAEEEKEEVKPEENEKPPKDKKKLIIIIVIAVVGLLVLVGGGFFGYKMLTDKQTEEAPVEEKNVGLDIVMLSFNPFILNLSDRGRYLKLNIQVELADKKHEEVVNAMLPQLRDAIIMLISDKSAQSISSAEGKFQLKEEILYRVNHVIGIDKDVITSIYFTDFVMQ